MKKTFIFCLLACLMACATGCEKSNSANQNDNNDQFGKLISSATITIMGEDYMEYNFLYDQNNRLSKMDIQINDSYYPEPRHMTCSYTYTTNKIKMNVVGDDAYGSLNNDYIAEYLLNDATPYSCQREGDFEANDFHIGNRESYVYENGYLKTRHVMYEDQSIDPFSGEYVWKDGNIQSITYSTFNNKQIVFSFIYDSRPDRSNLDLVKLLYYLNFYRGGHYTADKTVFKGMSCKQLLKTYTLNKEETININYSLDKDGYVIEAIVTMNGSPYMILSLQYKSLN